MGNGIEYECRKLEINVDEIIRICKNIGAEYIGTFWQKRFVYDFIPAEKGRWVRLRCNGKKTTLTVKEIKSLRISGTKELEIEVSDFSDTNEMLDKLGYYPRTYQENFRIEYSLNGVNIDIDKWPGIPWYVEIEGDNEESVFNMIEMLGFKLQDVTTLDVERVYTQIYGIQINSIKELMFSEKEVNEINKYQE